MGKVSSSSWPVSIEAIHKIVSAHKIPKSRQELVAILKQLDLDDISEAAAEHSDYAEQCLAVDVEIEDQLMDFGIIPPGTKPIFGEEKHPFRDPEEIPWSNLNFFNRKPGVGKYVIPHNREFGYKLKESLALIDREDRGEQIWALMEIMTACFPDDEEEEAAVNHDMEREAGGAKFKMSVFDNDFFDLSMNLAGLRAIQTALARLVSRRCILEKGIFIFFRKIEDVICKQEHGVLKQEHGVHKQDFLRGPSRVVDEEYHHPVTSFQSSYRP